LKQLALSRYEIRSVLGRGGAGVVYEAYDARDRTVVALKTIASPVADDLLRLKIEFRSLADLHHPNLVRYGELTSERGQWYFTMELIRGQNFVHYVRPATGFTLAHDVTRSEARLAVPAAHEHEAHGLRVVSGASASRQPFDEARLRAALPQLVSALSTLHASGRVHRDVKPSNVLVTEEGRVVLLDFGLVAASAQVDVLDADAIVGTPAFMAPEQVEGGSVQAAADWYAVGVMLFASLTGSLPFDGETTAVLTAKTRREAPSPDERVLGLPRDLSELCVALLRRAPEERPRGDEIAHRLGQTASEPFPSNVRHPDAPFVGREAEIRTLEGAFADVRAGAGGRHVIVEGEPGIGKSALVQRFLGAIGPDVLVLSGRCYEQEAVPFKGIDGIIDAISEHLVMLTDADARALLRGGFRYLAAVFPVLQRVPVIGGVVSSVREVADPAALREQAFGELERLLGELAREQPIVLFVDDLQWADRDSLDLLQRALVGAGAAPCLFIATLRAGADAAWEPNGLLTGAIRISLHALSSTESRSLLDALVTTQSRGRIDRESLVAEAHGHPLYLAELARSVRAGASPIAAKAKLQDVLWDRIASLDDIDRRLMEMVAVAGAPVPYEVVAKAAGVDVGECQNRLGSLRAAHLLRVGRRGLERLIEPYHDRVREAILPRLGSVAARAEQHLRFGRTLLESTPQSALGARVFAIVQHLNAARDLLVDAAERRRVAELNLLACRQAQRATAYVRARDHARFGLELLGEAAWSEAYEVTRDLHLACMAAETFAGDAAAAAECFTRARANLTVPADKTRLYVEWIGLQTSRGHLAEAVDIGRERLHELGVSVPAKASVLGVLAQYGRCRYHQGRLRTSDLLHLMKLEDPVREGAIELVVAMAPAAFFLDSNLLAWLALEGVALSLRYGVSNVSAYCFAVYGTVLTAVFGKHDEGESFGRLALALNERFQNHDLAARLHFLYGGWHSPWVRPFKDGIDFLRTANELATKYGDTAYETYAASTRSLVAFSEGGGLAPLLEMGEWAREIGVRRLDKDMAGFADVFVRYASALLGKTPSPRDLSLEGSSDADLRASLTDAKTPSSVYYYYYCDAELAYLSGDAARALPLLEEAWKRTQIIFGLPTTVDLWWLDALVAARLHDDASWAARIGLKRRVSKRVTKLRSWARSCPMNFEPQHHIACAELLRIGGDPRGAETQLERAVTAARAHRAPKREAVAVALAARLAEAAGHDATARWREAEEAYRRWGAVASPATMRSR
jgi:predicted ATPase